MRTERVDAFVLTAIECEYLAVVGHLEPGRDRRTADGAVHETGHFAGHHGRLTVGVQLAGQGNELAAVLAERAIARLRPRVLLLVGVAGGRKDARLGDVVVADTVYGYESGRDERGVFRPRVKSWPSAFALVQRARLVAADRRWQGRIAPPPAETPAAYVGALAAGSKVVAHAESASGRLLAEVAGDTLAVETEGLGLLTAARTNPRVQALVVRGVSDLLGDKDAAHDTHWQPVAARHAAAFAFELLASLEAAGAPDSVDAPGVPGSPDTPGVPPRSARTPRGAALSTRQLGELTTLLLDVPGIGAPAAWQQLLDALPGIGVLTSRQHSVRLEALSLLRTCESMRGWEPLMEALDALWPGTPAVEEVRSYLMARQLI
ncbi:phosphorylase family protein [Streptomyces sp. NPDC001675]